MKSMKHFALLSAVMCLLGTINVEAKRRTPVTSPVERSVTPAVNYQPNIDNANQALAMPAQSACPVSKKKEARSFVAKYKKELAIGASAAATAATVAGGYYFRDSKVVKPVIDCAKASGRYARDLRICTGGYVAKAAKYAKDKAAWLIGLVPFGGKAIASSISPNVITDQRFDDNPQTLTQGLLGVDRVNRNKRLFDVTKKRFISWFNEKADKVASLVATDEASAAIQ